MNNTVELAIFLLIVAWWVWFLVRRVRLRPTQLRKEGIVLWHPMYRNGEYTPGGISRPIVDYGISSRDDVLKHWKNPDRILRLEIDPDTLGVISSRSEKP